MKSSKTKNAKNSLLPKQHKKTLPVTILLNNPTAAIVTVLARCQKCEGCLNLGKIQSMLYPISCERRILCSHNIFYHTTEPAMIVKKNLFY